MTDKVENKAAEDAPKAIKSAEEKDLHRLHGEASREVSEILAAADNPKDNPEAHIDFDKAAKELESTPGDVREKLAVRMKEVEDTSAELIGRNFKRRAVAAANSDVSHLETPYQYSDDGIVVPQGRGGYIQSLAAAQDDAFRREWADRENYQPPAGASLVRETFKDVNPLHFAATNIRSTMLDPNDDLDHGRMVVMYNDPMVPIQTRFSSVGTVNGGDSYTYYKELSAGGLGTKKDNKVATVAENAKFADQEYQAQKVTVVAEKIAAFSKITEEQLEDVNVAREFVNTRLRRNFAQVLESQVVNGDGSSPNWQGLTDFANIQSQAVAKKGQTGASRMFDVFIDAWQKLIGVAYVTPNLIAFRSATAAQLGKFKDADGRYVWSNVFNGMPSQIIGIPVVYSEHVTANTALVIDTSEFAILKKRELSIEWGMSGDDFIMDVQTVRGTMRGNMLAWRENALINLTGLDNVYDN